MNERVVFIEVVKFILQGGMNESDVYKSDKGRFARGIEGKWCL
ncbi:hypothetical protein [Gracilibacillus sp. JCM 18860]